MTHPLLAPILQAIAERLLYSGDVREQRMCEAITRILEGRAPEPPLFHQPRHTPHRFADGSEACEPRRAG